MIALHIIFAMVLVVLCMSLANRDVRDRGRIGLVSWSLVAIGGMYGAGGAFVFSVSSWQEIPGWPTLSSELGASLVMYPLALVLAIGVVVGAAMVRPRINNYTFPRRSYWVLFLAMLLTAVVAQYLYVQIYGGWLGVFDGAMALRSGTSEIVNPFSVLQKFGVLAIISSFGFAGEVISRRRSALMWSLFIASVLVSIYILLTWLGRVAIVVYLISFPLAVVMAREKRILRIAQICAIVLCVVVLGAYVYSEISGDRQRADIVSFAASELAFPFANISYWLSESNIDFRWFYDVVTYPLYVLPSSLWSQWIQPIEEVNTIAHLGAAKGTGGVTGGIPVDVLTLGYLQAGAVGVILIGVTVGVILRHCEVLLYKIDNKYVRNVFIAYCSLKVASLGVMYFQPSQFVGDNIILYCSLIVMVWSQRVRWLSSAV